MVANIVALGAIHSITEIVSQESLQKAVLSRVPKGTEELNKAALKEGYELVK
jgi:2-oxoglutarate ferredoxin oxidoreductase subunit gamma